ncbi:MAG: gamma carbonic anhydrase family protein [Akkermansia sp.]
MSIETFRGQRPELCRPAFVADSADLIGAVRLGEGSSVWHHATLRADLAPIVIGRGSNVQDNSCIHVEEGLPCIVGEEVTIGHSVTLHACTVEDGALIGMGATVLDGAVIGRGSIVGANALVTKNTRIPPHSLVLGSPAKVVRSLEPAAEEQQRAHARDYAALAREYAAR